MPTRRSSLPDLAGRPSRVRVLDNKKPGACEGTAEPKNSAILRYPVLQSGAAQDLAPWILVLSKDPGHWQAPPPRRSSLDLQMRNGLPQIRQFWKTKTVQLRIWKHVYLTPVVRLNLYTRRFTICIGPSPGVGWHLRPGGIRSTLDTGTAEPSESYRQLVHPQTRRKNKDVFEPSLRLRWKASD